MATILFNAFSFLQKTLKARNRPYTNVTMDIKDGTTVRDLVIQVGLEIEDVEGAFVNGSISSLDREIHDGDRIALIPPGTPGPYRVLLGIMGKKDKGHE